MNWRFSITTRPIPMAANLWLVLFLIPIQLPWVGVVMAAGTGYQELLEAIRRRDLTQVNMLLDAGVSVDAIGDARQTAFMLAIRVGNQRIVRALLDRQAPVNAADPSGRTPLMTAVLGQLGIARLLLDFGADVNAKDRDGRTALMEATMFGQTDMVQVLLQRGADVNAHDSDGFTALRLATFGKRTKIIDLLKAHGATK